MSTTELYAVNKNGDVTPYGEAKNSWLGGMHVWNSLNEKYALNDDMMFGFKKTWGNFNKGFYEEYEDVLLGSTFDKVIVLKENFEQLISNFEKYLAVYPNSNFGQQIEIIQAMKEDEDVIGVAWCQTSVADDLWDFAYDDEEDETIPYNVFKGEEHWNLFAELTVS
ncbi:hypothetical protein [Enterococcus dongliensis]|uniref:hypothetical protein n=1 Tax=Enterococcus dongliensis TaxID=2559925 RepID=UPI00288D4688|nr:hypothetical protein [Enterococcus dongliensis]MDT2675355.1 hypothetical protein [Enterococcus dongliensis]